MERWYVFTTHDVPQGDVPYGEYRHRLFAICNKEYDAETIVTEMNRLWGSDMHCYRKLTESVAFDGKFFISAIARN